MNISATINSLRLLYTPTLVLPHLVISTFNSLPVPLRIPITKADGTATGKTQEIKAIILDKDNCFAKAYDDKVWPEYTEKWKQLRAAYPGDRLLIVSNSAGSDDDKNHAEAKFIEETTGVTVFKHSTKKPGCHKDIMDHLTKNGLVKGPHEVAVVGDRLMTDIMMANTMGSYGIWVKDGVVPPTSLICKLEKIVYSNLVTRGFKPPCPV
ncbi:HAD-superfamily phosphatase [Nadsonia fulvescens var. elongata DSM 6958]|uniref:HAD-superfamily phosphatase n=1 Tax=Nadsonia fulvescens var. elongata DSM 6958 TaxID=857566 RepID=A0A1E3PDT5_9ASCO|nr:HAD-superfamily phosphatase [Nadsonia fulvescens var. elongata DSM 6958]